MKNVCCAHPMHAIRMSWGPYSPFSTDVQIKSYQSIYSILFCPQRSGSSLTAMIFKIFLPFLMALQPFLELSFSWFFFFSSLPRVSLSPVHCVDCHSLSYFSPSLFLFTKYVTKYSGKAPLDGAVHCQRDTTSELSGKSLSEMCLHQGGLWACLS